jgi:hypothetical protein
MVGGQVVVAAITTPSTEEFQAQGCAKMQFMNAIP